MLWHETNLASCVAGTLFQREIAMTVAFVICVTRDSLEFLLTKIVSRNDESKENASFESKGMRKYFW